MKIGILGAGTWGITLAKLLCNEGKSVTVWSAIEKEIDELQKTRRHPNLIDIDLPSEIAYTKDIKEACVDMDIVVFAVPSPFVRTTAKKASPYLTDGQIVVDVAKGIEEETLLTMTEIIRDEINNNDIKIVALSGPTHAEEVVKELPTAIVSASEDISAAQVVQRVFATNYLRVYTNDDVRGVEICGAFKNVIALASGIITGLGGGDNARAAIITRGIAEISRLGMAMGCREQTFSGLAGIGDLIVTATSMHSRNNCCGILIGKGMSVDEARKHIGMEVEGINALPAAISLSKKYNVEMPIVEMVQGVVSGRLNPTEAAHALISREQKSEIGVTVFSQN